MGLLNVTSDSYTAAWIPLPRALFCEWISMVWMSLDHLNGLADTVAGTMYAKATASRGE